MARAVSKTQMPGTARLSPWIRAFGAALRTAFILTILAVTVRVSLPQNETLLTAYDTGGDFVRLLLGVIVSLWMIVQLFRLPRDPEAYRTWSVMGLAAVPFAILVAVVAW